MARTRTKAGDVSAKRGEDEFLSGTATGKVPEKVKCENCSKEWPLGAKSEVKVFGLDSWQCPYCQQIHHHSWDVSPERLRATFADRELSRKKESKSSERSEDLPPPQRTTDRIVAEVTASSGEMKIAMDKVQKYGSISVGPFFVKLVVAEGETPADALRRAREIADAQLLDAARTKAKAFSKIVDEIEEGR